MKNSHVSLRQRIFTWSTTPVIRQTQHTECGVVALQLMLAHYGIHKPLEEMREATGVSRAGCNARTLIHAAKLYGLNLKAIVCEPQNLRRHKFPFIVYVSFRHFMLVEGMDDQYVYINDPHLGPSKSTLASFDDTFTGVALTHHLVLNGFAFRPMRSIYHVTRKRKPEPSHDRPPD